MEVSIKEELTEVEEILPTPRDSEMEVDPCTIYDEPAIKFDMDLEDPDATELSPQDDPLLLPPLPAIVAEGGQLSTARSRPSTRYGQLKYECSACGKRFSRTSKGKRHLRGVPGPTKKIKRSRFCQKTFLSKGSRDCHEAGHRNMGICATAPTLRKRIILDVSEIKDTDSDSLRNGTTPQLQKHGGANKDCQFNGIMSYQETLGTRPSSSKTCSKTLATIGDGWKDFVKSVPTVRFGTLFECKLCFKKLRCNVRQHVVKHARNGELIESQKCVSSDQGSALDVEGQSEANRELVPPLTKKGRTLTDVPPDHVAGSEINALMEVEVKLEVDLEEEQQVPIGSYEMGFGVRPMGEQEESDLLASNPVQRLEEVDLDLPSEPSSSSQSMISIVQLPLQVSGRPMTNTMQLPDEKFTRMKQHTKKIPVLTHWEKKIMELTEGGMIQCKVCTQNFQTKAEIKEHGRVQHGRKIRGRKRLLFSRDRVKREKRRLERKFKSEDDPTAFKCTKCGNIFRHKFTAQNHLRKYHGLAPSARDLEELFGPTLEPIERVKVGKTYVQLVGWAKKYMDIIPGDRPFQCKLCPNNYATKYALSGHVRVHPEALCGKCSNIHRDGQVECPIPKPRGIKIPDRKPNMCYCDMCGAEFRRRETLAVHKMNSRKRKELTSNEMTWIIYHSEETENPFQCKACTESFPGRCSLRRHCNLTSHSTSIVHPGRKTLLNPRCAKCKLTFHDFKALDEHSAQDLDCRTITPECNQCGKKFGNRRDLFRHMSVVHSTEREHLCAICGYAAKARDTLVSHSKIHDKERPRFKCDVCNYTSIFKNNVEQHRRVHTGEKPFLCDQCPYAASTNQSLQLHFRRHLKTQPGENDQPEPPKPKPARPRRKRKKQTCGVCNKVFTTLHGLRSHKFLQHEATSNGAPKPTAFSCTLCKKQFTQYTNAGAHVRRHHKEELMDSDGKSTGKRITDFVHVDESKRPPRRVPSWKKYESKESDRT